jgi:hypothetical protein
LQVLCCGASESEFYFVETAEQALIAAIIDCGNRSSSVSLLKAGAATFYAGVFPASLAVDAGYLRGMGTLDASEPGLDVAFGIE